MTHSRPLIAAVALACATSWAGAACSFEIEQSETRYADRRYHCELRIHLDAPLEKVEAVLRDYERYPSLDARILQARVLERPGADVVVLETILRGCFGPFCRNVTRVERVEESPHALVATADPARSDVKFGETHTRLAAADKGGTVVSYRTSLTPAFWVPSLVGRRWMLRTLEDATADLFMNVEMRAREGQWAAPPPPP
jgi:hypothetical protein